MKMSFAKRRFNIKTAVTLSTTAILAALISCTGYDNADTKPITCTLNATPTQCDTSKTIYYTQDLSEYLNVNLEITNASLATFTWYAVPLTTDSEITKAVRSLDKTTQSQTRTTVKNTESNKTQATTDDTSEQTTDADTQNQTVISADMAKNAVKLVVHTKDVSELEQASDKLTSASYLNAWYYCVVELKNSVYTESYTTEPILLLQSLKTDGIDIIYINTVDGKDITSSTDTTLGSAKKPCKATVTYNGTYETNITTLEDTIFNQDKKAYEFNCGTTQYTLLDMYCDKSLMRTSFTSYLINNIFTKLNPSTEYTPVNLVLNGRYQGLYLIGTKPEESSLFTMLQGTTPVTSYSITTDSNNSYSITSPAKLDAKTASFIKQTVIDTENAIESLTDYSDYLDVDQAVDYYLLSLVTKNYETPIVYQYNEASKLFEMGPVILADNSMGGDVDKQIEYSLWINKLLQDNTFKAKVLTRYKALKPQLEKSSLYIEENYALLQEAAKANFSRWPILGTYVTPDDPGYTERTTYKAEVDYLADWVDNRLVWIDTYLADEFLME